MITNQIFASVLIAFGGVIMFPAVLRTRQMLSLLTERKSIRIWRVLFALSAFFIACYLITLCLVLAQKTAPLVSLIGLVFFFGALYVYFVARISHVTIQKLLKTAEEKQKAIEDNLRLETELQVARRLQQDFLPEDVPEIKGIELAASNLPAREVGGDFYDFIPIAKDKWGIVVADVSGKGVPAALFMALSRTLIRASTTGNPTVVNAIEKANELICADSKSSMFVTLFYAIIDSQKMKLKYINAGHNPPLLVREAAGDVRLLKAEGIALGVIEDIELQEVEIELTSGDVVVLFTDGITEANNEKEEEFGEERVIKVI